MKVVLMYLLSVVMAGAVVFTANVMLRPAPNPTYVVGGQNSPDGTVSWLVIVPCSKNPVGWADARANCDFTKVQAIATSPETYAKYDQGSVYP